MTVLHVLSCNPNATIEMIQELASKCVGAAFVKTKSDLYPVDLYLLTKNIVKGFFKDEEDDEDREEEEEDSDDEDSEEEDSEEAEDSNDEDSDDEDSEEENCDEEVSLNNLYPRSFYIWYTLIGYIRRLMQRGAGYYDIHDLIKSNLPYDYNKWNILLAFQGTSINAEMSNQKTSTGLQSINTAAVLFQRNDHYIWCMRWP